MKKTILIAMILIVMLTLMSCANNVSSTDSINAEASTPVESTAATGQGGTSVESEEETASSTPLDEAELAVGKEIPDFQFETLDGDFINLHDYNGKIIMLNFWATWCPYCVEEMPDLDAMNQEDDVVVLAINARETKKTINNYLENENYSFEVILDGPGYFSDMFYVSSLPTTFFINEEGVLLGSMPGMMTKEQMEQIIQDIRDDIL